MSNDYILIPGSVVYLIRFYVIAHGEVSKSLITRNDDCMLAKKEKRGNELPAGSLFSPFSIISV